MTPKQTALYWRTWGAVCVEMGWPNSDNERRYALHRQAGCKPSMREFTNRDLDLFLAQARRLLGAKSTASTAAEAGERKRLIWRIRQDARLAGLEAAYLEKLSTDLYGLGCWEELAIDDLTNFRNVIHDRAGSHLGQDTRTVARSARKYVLKPTKNFTPQPAATHAGTNPF